MLQCHLTFIVDSYELLGMLRVEIGGLHWTNFDGPLLCNLEPRLEKCLAFTLVHASLHPVLQIEDLQLTNADLNGADSLHSSQDTTAATTIPQSPLRWRRIRCSCTLTNRGPVSTALTEHGQTAAEDYISLRWIGARRSVL